MDHTVKVEGVTHKHVHRLMMYPRVCLLLVNFPGRWRDREQSYLPEHKDGHLHTSTHLPHRVVYMKNHLNQLQLHYLI